MKKTFFRKSLSVLMAVLLFVLPIQSFAEESEGSSSAATQFYGQYQFSILSVASKIIENGYCFGVTSGDLLAEAFYEKLVNPSADVEDMLNVMTDSLDPHSSYLNAEEYKYMMDHTISGTFAGIGVSVVQAGDRVVVVSPMAGSPAEEAGIEANDVIISVNGEGMIGKSVQYIQSVISGEEGTAVSIGVQRGDKILNFDMKRAIIRDKTVTWSVKDGIGIIRVASYNPTTAEDAKKALEDFDRQGIKNIVIDERNNPGGELQSVVDFCNLFIPKGPVATMKFKDSQNDETYYSTLEKPKYKLAVLINGGSASAAELFAAAVKDTKVGAIIGENSYGKGTMQTLIPFEYTGGALRLTVAEYFSAHGNRVNGVGVKPDYTVHDDAIYKDVSYLEPIELTKESRIYDESDNVLAIEQRLELLGYFEEKPDKFFDEETKKALEMYQTFRKLPVTGTPNHETSLDLNSIDFENMAFSNEAQMNTALNDLKTGAFPQE